MRFKSSLKTKLVNIYLELNKEINPYPPIRISEDLYSHFPPYIIKALYDLSRANNPKIPFNVLVNMLRTLLDFSESDRIKSQEGYEEYQQNVKELVESTLNHGSSKTIESHVNSIVNGSYPDEVKVQLDVLKKSIQFTQSTIGDFIDKASKKLTIKSSRASLIQVLIDPLPTSLQNVYKIDPPIKKVLVKQPNNYTVIVGIDGTGSMQSAINGASSFILVSSVLDTLLKECSKVISFTFRCGKITEETPIKVVDKNNIIQFKDSIDFRGGPTDVKFLFKNLVDSLQKEYAYLEINKPICLFLITDDTDHIPSSSRQYIKKLLRDMDITLAIIHISDTYDRSFGSLKEVAHNYISIP